VGESGFWFAVIATAISIGTFYLQYREHHRTASQDEVTSLRRQLEDLRRQNELCELRCDELRENMLALMTQSPAKRKRRVVQTST
jgi:phage shock protein A